MVQVLAKRFLLMTAIFAIMSFLVACDGEQKVENPSIKGGGGIKNNPGATNK